MKRTSSRLLTPAQMESLLQEVYERDGGCRGKVWPLHRCGGFRHGSMYEAHHLVEQAALKVAYGKLGGLWWAPGHHGPEDPGFFRPRTRHDFGEPDITASEIATDPDLSICLCCNLHTRWPNLTPEEKLEIVGDHLPVVTAAANRYSLEDRLLEGLNGVAWQTIYEVQKGYTWKE